MTYRLRMSVGNALDAATLSASPPLDPILDVDNLKLTTRSFMARTTSTADQTILGDFPNPEMISMMAMWRHNFSYTAKVRLELFSGSAQSGTLVYDSGEIFPYESKTLGELKWGLDPFGSNVFDTWDYAFTDLWFNQVVARSFRITIKDPANPDGYIEVSRIVLSAYFSPAVSASYGVSMALIDNSEIVRSAGGSIHVNAKPYYRTMEFSLDNLTDIEGRKLFSTYVQHSRRRDIYVSLFTGRGGEMERDHAMLGVIPKDAPITLADFDNNVSKIYLEEV